MCLMAQSNPEAQTFETKSSKEYARLFPYAFCCSSERSSVFSCASWILEAMGVQHSSRHPPRPSCTRQLSRVVSVLEIILSLEFNPRLFGSADVRTGYPKNHDMLVYILARARKSSSDF